mmetsp:Transcript_14815/g.40531  ORF Transcript_14815/g.40531 Transcript_14815/m.40531 type:complete len:110 (+) Transcript_14815:201-530(+)
MQLLEARSRVLQMNIDKLNQEIKGLMAQKNKKAALQKLKYRKKYEQSMDQIEAQKDNIQTLKMKLEEALMQKNTADAYKTASVAFADMAKWDGGRPCQCCHVLSLLEWF